MGGIGAILGNHIYPVYVASIGVAAAFAYGGMWWLSRLFGLSRWIAHLPAFVVVTAAYYLTDAYARGAWPELIAISAVPMFIAGAVRLLSGPWRAWPVLLFLIATVFMTGSHNITLLWSAMLFAVVAVAIWIVLGSARPAPRAMLALVAVAAVGAGVNAWFLLFDLAHAGETLAWTKNLDFLKTFGPYFYFDNLPNVLDPLRQTPVQSTTPGLTIAAPVAAFLFGLVLVWLSWPAAKRAGRLLASVWLIMLGVMALLVGLLVMPREWWNALGTPFIDIQFPYRLAGWLLIAIAVQLAISLRYARGLHGVRWKVAIGLGAALVVLTVVQASAQLYSAPRLNGETGHDIHPREYAFDSGPSTPPNTYYASRYYGDSSLPLVQTQPGRAVAFPAPEPGQTRYAVTFQLPGREGPIVTNIAAGPYAVTVEGMRLVGRSETGTMVLEPEPSNATMVHLVIKADAGKAATVGTAITILCLLVGIGLVVLLALRPPGALWSRPLLPRRR
ncbi:MAG: hypothetical protein JSS97_03250 [Actinobacteria bacterium]|nr:hypothetical protein [Actinomycetota bacterium]